MEPDPHLRIAIQKSGRLSDVCQHLLWKAGINLLFSERTLVVTSSNHPIDVVRVRNSDIPSLVMEGNVDIGVTGENMLCEKRLQRLERNQKAGYTTLGYLGFGQCRLSIAVPTNFAFTDLSCLQGCRIATSYPMLLKQYLHLHDVHADIVPLTGSVEVAPSIGMADAICDLVSTGATLTSNHLVEVAQVMRSQVLMIKHLGKLSDRNAHTLSAILKRLNGISGQAVTSPDHAHHLPGSA
ncbi:ATP phosphoribosyltransferase [Alteromonas sp. ASW11-130]|uniref:ATP phosphoribosyltransferase n=1 Tax=Alteromonas sp. ASW11-130 TaxID=3015775 RepID=UPI0022420104|nr:ATP phosphoribosyltransferase [Alteromonas sp. ASW11-130]